MDPDVQGAHAWPRDFGTHGVLLDIGCAKGDFVRSLHAHDAEAAALDPLQPRWSFCGVELRQGLVDAAVAEGSCDTLQFVARDMARQPETLLADEEGDPCSPLRRILAATVQFPTPFKEHAARDARRGIRAGRGLLTPRLVRSLACATLPGALLYVASDVEHVALDMRRCVLDGGCFDASVHERDRAIDAVPWVDPTALHDVDEHGWLRRRLFVAPSERERVCETLWRPVYRACFWRNAVKL